MICLPASVWLLNKEVGSYEEKTFQIKIPTNAFELGPKNTFPLHVSWNATALKNIPTLDISTESNFWNGPLLKALHYPDLILPWKGKVSQFVNQSNG